MLNSNINYYKPKTIEEASDILMNIEDAAPIAGGTDLLVEIKKGMRNLSNFISLSGITELKSINEDEENIYIGAGLTHTEIVTSLLIRKKIPALSEAASKIGSHQIRNVGTIGGNLCTAASCADTAPILLAYNSRVELVSKNSKRILPLKEFLIFHHKTAIIKGEIMSRIIIPLKNHSSSACFEKFGIREASSISVASSAVFIEFDEGVCNDINVVIGACAPTPIISHNANKIILGTKLKDLNNDKDLIESVCYTASSDSIPIDDIRGSASYRRHLVKILTGRALKNSLNRIKEIK